ncbi:MAG: fatty acid oxidation complex subunit alpha FadJ [Vibrio sp.]
MKPKQAFQLSIDAQHYAWLAIDVPDEKINTLQAAFVEEMQAVFAALQQHTAPIKGLIIHSLKPDNFMAGADIRMLQACQSAQQAQELALQGQQIFQQLADLPFPVVAAIHGPCLGGGLELALACDYRVCSEEPITQLGLPEVRLGLLPGSGGTQRLPRLIGLLPALDLILTGKSLRARSAKKLGLVDACVPHSVLLEVAVRLLEQNQHHKRTSRRLSLQQTMLAKTGLGRKLVFEQARRKTALKTRGNYPAIPAILAVIEFGLEHGMSAGLAAEAKRFGELVMSPQSKALRSIFLATSEMKKEFGVCTEPAVVGAVGVLGGGLMGAGISHVTLAKAKLPVRIKDVTNDGVLHALRYNYQLFDKQKQRSRLSQAQLQARMAQLTGGTDWVGFERCDVVIEAVFEDLKLKQQMVAEIEEHAKPTTIFATNTSSLPIEQIASQAARPAQIVGLHYFSPVEKMPLVEVIPHRHTSPQTIATVVDFARKQGKTPIVVQDRAGFYVNRILAPYLNEAAQILLTGEPIDKIDRALLDFGFPVGPLALIDEVGIDIGAKIMPILVSELGPRFQGPEVFTALLNQQRKGRKSGKGFYLYSGANKKRVDKTVYQLLKLRPESKLNDKVLAMRCVLPMLNEAVRCLDEGIIRNPRDGDIGAIFGIGFPPFLGGPFRYLDTLGLAQVVEMMNQHTEQYGERFAPCDGLLTRAGLGETFYPLC